MMKKILILNLVPNTIGDSILMTPMFTTIKKNYPDSFLAATADRLTRDLWLNNKEIDKTILVKELETIGNHNAGKLKKAYAYFRMFFRLIRQIRAERFDACFIAYPNFFLMPLIPYLAGIKTKVGYTYKGSYLAFLLTKKTPSMLLFDDCYDRHIVYSFMDLLKAAGLSYSESDIVPRILVSEKELSAARKKLKKFKRLISVHALSKIVSKNWPKEKFRELLPILAKKYNATILLFGSKGEFGYNEEIKGSSEQIVNLCGQCSIRETAALIKLSDLFIGNDSGLGHIASSVGTNTISLFGSTDPVQAKPIGPGKVIVIFKNNRKNLFHYYKTGRIELDIESMNSITVRDVLAAVKTFLG
ncbi:glycosyltransferase family 9 protein [Candidatus Woesearchaeota archaeon]|nr:glycosyltransferase family 9 protein [Candidatus Woesearchaeota archaeon]